MIIKKISELNAIELNKIIDDRKLVVEYLQFFEMLAGLIEKDSISKADIDKL